MAKADRREQVVIVGKKSWQDFNAGQTKTLTIFKPGDLRHEFGDDPEPYIVRIKLTKL